MLDSKINKTVYEITPGSTPLGSGYQISFTFFSNDQIRVYLTNGLTQVEVDSSNYSIIKDETIYKVAFLSDYVFPSDAIRLVIAREVAFQQNTNLINGELIDAEVLERALDLLAAMSQQLKEITDRVVLSPISENTQTIIPEKSDRAGRILGFDEKGDPTSILTSDIDQKLKQSLSAQEQVILLSNIIEGYRNQAYQSAINAQTSEENVLVKEEQVSGTLVQIQNIKQQIDNIENAVELSQTNAAESSSSAAESANAAKELLDQADLNLIESIEQTLTSTESGGENQVTITQKSGNQSIFSIFNGKQGPAVPLVQTTGTSTTSAMSQKAVTDSLDSLKSDLVAKTNMLSFEEIMASTPPIDLDVGIPKASALKNYIIYEDNEVQTSISAGTIGTRGAQEIIDNNKEGYKIIGLFISFISNSSDYHPLIFLSNDKTYINFYRCISSAVSYVYIRYTVVYLKV